MEFLENRYYSYLIKGDLNEAIAYLKQFPEQKNRYDSMTDLFEREKYLSYGMEPELEKLLLFYQQYYRDTFYLCIDPQLAEAKLRERLIAFFSITDQEIQLSDLEEDHVGKAFRRKGFHFQGGRTGGYLGPYIWKTTETKTYEVELPDGHQEYSVNLLDGFIMNSWLNYVSLGKIGTGGWTDGDGIIHCVKASYDFESENFRISLLKHEAQHVADLEAAPHMSSADLEYRAKLVELMYSEERPLLESFLAEADRSDNANGHTAAADRIIEGFSRISNLERDALSEITVEQVHSIAGALFKESSVLLETAK